MFEHFIYFACMYIDFISQSLLLLFRQHTDMSCNTVAVVLLFNRPALES